MCGADGNGIFRGYADGRETGERRGDCEYCGAWESDFWEEDGGGDLSGRRCGDDGKDEGGDGEDDSAVGDLSE